MQPAPAPQPRRRRLWPWILGFCLLPFVAVGLAAYSILTLDHAASVLRRHVMAATDSDWHTRVQVSTGRATLGLARLVLTWVHDPHVADARLALKAVKSASVGVYELADGSAAWSYDELFSKTDEAMRKRGWNRLVGVADDKNIVLIYTDGDPDGTGPIDICLAVVDDRELVVASTTIDSTKALDLIARHLPPDFPRKLHLALR